MFNNIFWDNRAGSWTGGAALLWMLSVMAGCGASNPHPVGSYERGVFFAEQGKDIEAVAALESYIRKNPTDSLTAEDVANRVVELFETRR